MRELSGTIKTSSGAGAGGGGGMHNAWSRGAAISPDYRPARGSGSRPGVAVDF